MSSISSAAVLAFIGIGDVSLIRPGLIVLDHIHLSIGIWVSAPRSGQFFSSFAFGQGQLSLNC
jgi:hypothetical protein